MMRPTDQFGNFSRIDKSTKAIHAGDSGFYLWIISEMRSQHFRVSETRANHRCVNTATHKILAGSAHHAQLCMLAGDITEGVCYRLFRQGRANEEYAR